MRSVLSEDPLHVFVSSVMDEEMMEARKIVESSIKESHILKTWLFEFTPASTFSVENTYLQKVKSADYVIWLIGSHTTEPVAKEIKECLAAKKENLLIFLLPSYVKDFMTEELLKIIGNSFKWKKVESFDLLGDEVNSAISDDLVKSVRLKNNTIKIGFEDMINDKIKTTKERIISHWTSLGLHYNIANTFFNNSAIAVVKSQYKPTTEMPFKILYGDMGSGKTLIAERYYYEELLLLKKNNKHPIPIFLNANCISVLKNAIEFELSKFNNIQSESKTIIIDGLDEVSFKKSKQILEECNTEIRIDNNVKFLITTRHKPSNFDNKSIVNIELLNRSEIGNIFDIILGTSDQVKKFSSRTNFDRDWAFSVKEAVKRPLFAIFIAKFIGNETVLHKVSIYEIIQKVVKEILILDDYDSNIEGILVELSVKIIDKQFKRINEKELNLTYNELLALQRSHFIDYFNNLFSFRISLFLDWFACQKLLKDENFINNIINNSTCIENWRFPFILLISTASFDVSSKLLIPLIKNHPSFAGSLIIECLDKSTLSESFNYSEVNVKNQMELAFQSWLEAMNPELIKKIAPVNDFGVLKQYEISIKNKTISIIWPKENSFDQADVQEMFNRHIFSIDKGLISKALMIPIKNKPDSWVWYLVFEYLTKELEKCLKEESFYLDDGILFYEKIWTSALALSQRNEIPNKVSIPDIENRYEQGMTGKLHTSIFHKNRTIDLTWLSNKLQLLKDKNIYEISDPHPQHSRVQGEWSRPWDYFFNFNSEQIYNRVSNIFNTAILGYKQIVEKYFSCLSGGLRLYSMLPVQIKGFIVKDKLMTPDNSIQIEYYFDVLPNNEDSKTDFELIEKNNISFDSSKIERIFTEISENIKSLRPEKLFVIQGGTYSTDLINPIVPDPTTRLVYRWLWDDLMRISWVRDSYSDMRNR